MERPSSEASRKSIIPPTTPIEYRPFEARFSDYREVKTLQGVTLLTASDKIATFISALKANKNQLAQDEKLLEELIPTLEGIIYQVRDLEYLSKVFFVVIAGYCNFHLKKSYPWLF